MEIIGILDKLVKVPAQLTLKLKSPKLEMILG